MTDQQKMIDALLKAVDNLDKRVAKLERESVEKVPTPPGRIARRRPHPGK